MSAWKEYKANLGVTRPWDLLNPNQEKSEDAEQSKRFDICMACPELIQATKQCKQCGCFMKMKVKLKRAQCPLGKW